MLGEIVAYLAGGGTVLAVRPLLRRRQTGAEPALAGQAAARPLNPTARPLNPAARELGEVITELGEQAVQLTFDPVAEGVPPESVADYQRALDSYRQARDLLDADPTALAPVRQALATGRNALIRLDARTHGRPVPVDISRPVRGTGQAPPPQPHQGARFSYTGSVERSYDFPIDWPVPGDDAIAVFERNGTGATWLRVVSIVEGDDGGDGGGPRKKACDSDLVSGTASGRYLLDHSPGQYDPLPTHLEIEPWDSRPSHGAWSLRLLPIGEAARIGREHQGVGLDVLIHGSPGPARLGVQVDGGDDWKVSFHCRTRHRRPNACRTASHELRAYRSDEPERPRSMPVCERGIVVVDADPAARWSLSVIKPPAPSRDPLSVARRALGLD